MSPAQAATLTVPKLKAELSELGLPTSGLKAVLLERLQAALSEPAAATAGAPAAVAARKSAASKAAASEPRAAPTPKPLAAKRGPASPSAAAKRPKAAVPAAAGGGGGGATTQREEAAWARGVQLCVGCDEAGRGPLAGPVVAAACALPATAARIPGVSDSKTIVDEAAREEIYAQIVGTPGVVWSASVVSASRIDEVNILMASLEAMRLCVTDVLQRKPQVTRALALIDGPFSPWKEGEKYADFQAAQPPSAV